jgi:hypothetical protein
MNMLSSAAKLKSQGVSSAYIEQVNIVQNGLRIMMNGVANLGNVMNFI